MSEDAQSISSSEGEISEEGEESKVENEKKNGSKIDSEKEEGELEEGELETDSDDELTLNNGRPRIVALPDNSNSDLPPLISNVDKAVGLCRFYQRGLCNWGDNCKYKHIKESNNWKSGRSVFIAGDQPPVPLLSVHTSLPQRQWDRAVGGDSRIHKKVGSARREVLEDTSSKHPRHKRRSSSRSRSPRRSTDNEIPSLLDMVPNYSKEPKSQNSYGRKYSQRSSRSPQTDSSRRKHNSGSTTSSRYVASTSNREPISNKRSNSSKRDKDYGKSRSKYVESEKRRNSKKTSNRRHSPHSGSNSPIGFRTKNPTNQQIEDFFAERDDEKPAAYRMDSNSSPEIKRTRSSSSSSSSSSTSSSSTASSKSNSTSRSSVSSSKRRKHSSKTYNPIQNIQAISDDSDEEQTPRKPINSKNSKIVMESERISSEDEEVVKNGDKIEPQQISSSEDEEKPKVEMESAKISSSSGEESINLKVESKRRREHSSGDKSDDQRSKHVKRRRRRSKRSSISSDSDEYVPPPPIDERAHEDAVLGMDIGEVLEEFESRTGGSQSPLTSSG